MMEMNRHAIEIFGSAEAASEHMPMMARLLDLQARWQAGHTSVKIADTVTSVRDMFKTTEQGMLWDKNNPKGFDEFVEKLMRGLWATGTNVTASQYLKGMQGAKGAYASWSDDFKFGVLPALIQEWPGAGVAAVEADSAAAEQVHTQLRPVGRARAGLADRRCQFT